MEVGALQLSLSQPCCSLAATSVGNLVLFGGGLISTGFSNVVDVFNWFTNTWTTATLSETRAELAATSAGNRYALFGGGYNGSESNVVDIFDSLTRKWSVRRLSQARGFLAAASLGSLALEVDKCQEGSYPMLLISSTYQHKHGEWQS
jgi:hypothetical protein